MADESSSNEEATLKVKTARQDLIRRATSPEFSPTAQKIGHNFNMVLFKERALMRDNHYLWVVPADAVVEPPLTGDPMADESIKTACDERFTSRTGPALWAIDHPFEIKAYSRHGFHTFFTVNANTAAFPNYSWIIRPLCLDAINLAVDIVSHRGQIEIAPKFELPPDLADRLVRVLASITEGLEGTKREKSAAEADEEWRQVLRHRSWNESQEIAPLNLLVNHPESFCQQFAPENCWLVPERLMTEKEFSDWLKMCSRIMEISKGQEVKVADPGWGNRELYQAKFSPNLGAYLTTIGLDSSDQPSPGLYHEIIPIPVKKSSGSILGWTLCDVWWNHGRLGRVSFCHGAEQLYYFEMWKKKQEGR